MLLPVSAAGAVLAVERAANLRTCHDLELIFDRTHAGASRRQIFHHALFIIAENDATQDQIAWALIVEGVYRNFYIVRHGVVSQFGLNMCGQRQIQQLGARLGGFLKIGLLRQRLDLFNAGSDR